MLIFEYLVSENAGDMTIADSSGNNIDGQINQVRVEVPPLVPAVVSAENVPNGYSFKAIKYDVDAMPVSHGTGVEPDNQLQFLGVPINDLDAAAKAKIHAINATKAFTISLWAYHKAKPDPGGNPWNGPKTNLGKNLFCPQHVCIDKSMYTFVRTKDIGPPVVDLADRGQLAFTGPGDSEVISAGGIGNELGGVTSGDVHIPINEWIHLAFVLEAPAANSPIDQGVWRSYINGELVGDELSTTALSAAGLDLIKTTSTIDIRFGNFRGNDPAGNRPPPIEDEANDYAFHGYMTGFRMYDNALSAAEICDQIIADTTVVEPLDLNITFNDVPEGETTARAAVFTVKSFKPVTLLVIDGPTVDAGAPAGTEILLPTGASAVVPPPGNDPSVKGRIWMTFNGQNAGDTASGSIRIRVVETGQEFDFTITANVIPRPKVAAVMVLDKSNSMNFDAGNGKTRIEVLHESAPPFPQLLPSGDAIGVAAFDHDPSTLMNVKEAGAVGPFEVTRNEAIQAIANHAPNPSGNTAIGDGIERADQLLGTATADYNPGDYDVTATVVLTDGKETADQRIADVSGLIDTNNHIFAIGLGTVENIEPAALNAIANDTGGFLMMTGVLDINEQFKLAKYYLQIFAAVTNRDIVIDPQGNLLPGQTREVGFSLNEADISIDVVVLSPAPDLFDLSLKTPSGDIIDATTPATVSSVSHSVGKGVAFYRVTLPVVLNGNGNREGDWIAILSINERRYEKYLSGLTNTTHLPDTGSGGNFVVANGVPYNASVLSFSGVRLRAKVDQTGNEPGATLNLRANMTQYDIPLGSGNVTVYARLRRPDGAESTLMMAEAEEGVYRTQVSADISGIYDFHVFAEGTTFRERDFTREQIVTAGVWAGGDQPPPKTDEPSGILRECCKVLARIGYAIILLLIFLIYLGYWR